MFIKNSCINSIDKIIDSIYTIENRKLSYLSVDTVDLTDCGTTPSVDFISTLLLVIQAAFELTYEL